MNVISYKLWQRIELIRQHYIGGYYVHRAWNPYSQPTKPTTHVLISWGFFFYTRLVWSPLVTKSRICTFNLLVKQTVSMKAD